MNSYDGRGEEVISFACMSMVAYEFIIWEGRNILGRENNK